MLQQVTDGDWSGIMLNLILDVRSRVGDNHQLEHLEGVIYVELSNYWTVI